MLQGLFTLTRLLSFPLNFPNINVAKITPVMKILSPFYVCMFSRQFYPAKLESIASPEIIYSSESEVEVIEQQDHDSNLNVIFPYKISKAKPIFHVENRAIVIDVDDENEVDRLCSDRKEFCLLKSLDEKLLPHQVAGAQFMLNHILANEPRGCLLADAMGLGKTLQIITTIEVFLKEFKYLNKMQARVMILTPATVLLNWKSEIEKWLPNCKEMIPKILTSTKFAAALIPDWVKSGGILLLGYELFRTVAKSFDCLLKDADLCILDEGHRIKSHRTTLSKLLAKVKTKRRIILSGYPLQTKLREYFAMVNWVRPGIFGSYNNFRLTYEVPIAAYQHFDASKLQQSLGRKRLFKLQKELENVVLRRSANILNDSLPPRFEFAVFCSLSTFQEKLYHSFLEEITRLNESKVWFYIYNQLKMLCNHPDILRKHLEATIAKSEINNASQSGCLISKKKKSKVSGANELEVDSEDQESEQASDADLVVEESIAEKISSIWKKSILFSDQFIPSRFRDGKMKTLLGLLEEFERVGDKSVIFSRSLDTLDLIEELCESRKISFCRLDGTVNIHARSTMIQLFNSSSKNAPRVFLATTQAGGEGINLIAANRCIIFDVSFNPCSDGQAARRIYRFGQKKTCYVYRFVADQTLEAVIFKRLVARDSMVARVVDKTNVQRLFRKEELGDLFQHHVKYLPTHSDESSDVVICDVVEEANALDIALSQKLNSVEKMGKEIVEDAALAALLSLGLCLRVENYDTLLAADEDDVITEAEMAAAVEEKFARPNLLPPIVKKGLVNAAKGAQWPTKKDVQPLKRHFSQITQAIPPVERKIDFKNPFSFKKLFNGCKFFILEHGIESVRLNIFKENIKKNGGDLTPFGKCTHFIAREDPGYFLEWVQTVKASDVRPGVSYHTIEFLQHCLRTKSLLDATSYILPGFSDFLISSLPHS